MICYNLLNRLRAGPQWTRAKQILTPNTAPNNQSCRNLSNNLALISKIHREAYLRTYQALVVEPDGSSFYIRYQEPRNIIQLPLDISTLSEAEYKLRLSRRNPKKKVVFVQEEKDTYKPSQYIRLVKKVKN